jgi:hypothetical protein
VQHGVVGHVREREREEDGAGTTVDGDVAAGDDGGGEGRGTTTGDHRRRIDSAERDCFTAADQQQRAYRGKRVNR